MFDTINFYGSPNVILLNPSRLVLASLSHLLRKARANVVCRNKRKLKYKTHTKCLICFVSPFYFFPASTSRNFPRSLASHQVVERLKANRDQHAEIIFTVVHRIDNEETNVDRDADRRGVEHCKKTRVRNCHISLGLSAMMLDSLLLYFDRAWQSFDDNWQLDLLFESNKYQLVISHSWITAVMKWKPCSNREKNTTVKMTGHHHPCEREIQISCLRPPPAQPPQRKCQSEFFLSRHNNQSLKEKIEPQRSAARLCCLFVRDDQFIFPICFDMWTVLKRSKNFCDRIFADFAHSESSEMNGIPQSDSHGIVGGLIFNF